MSDSDHGALSYVEVAAEDVEYTFFDTGGDGAA